MTITLRARLFALVATVALAFLAMIGASAWLSARTEAQMDAIRERFIPRVELGPALAGALEGLGRAFQDAVAAHDPDALEATRQRKDRILAQLGAAKGAIDPTQAQQLAKAIEDYYAAGHDVARRLIAGETGEPIVGAISDMQQKRARATELLEQATAFDRRQLAEAFAAAARANAIAARTRLAISLGCLAVMVLLSAWMGTKFLRSLGALTTGLRRFEQGDLATPVQILGDDEIGAVARQANQMAACLARLSEERARGDWLKAGVAELSDALRGELGPEEVAERALRFLARRLEAPAAAMYAVEIDGTCRVMAEFAGRAAAPSFRVGEGLAGQAAREKEVVVVADPPPGYWKIESGLGAGSPRAIVLLPIHRLGKTTAVVELAFFRAEWSERAAEMCRSVRETLAIALEVAHARAAERDLLARAREQAQRLASAEEELRQSNEELRAQQEELRQTNEELAGQARELEEQRASLQERNRALDGTRVELEQKARELATVSAYKSQFVANMSHELRTPLNSMLLLSNLLAENEAGNLTPKQVEYAKTVYSAGKDLLGLINQVLDLAKVEAGKQEVRIEPVTLAEVARHVEQVFAPLARDKGLEFAFESAPGLPETIRSDRQRIEQILNNLLGNAIKFTSHGRVSVRLSRPDPGVRFRRDDLRADRAVALAVTDTGPGVAPEDRERIFARFEQAAPPEGRRAGTGLGLAIAREVAALLGGELQLSSTVGEGSTFVCYLPEEAPAVPAKPKVAALAPVAQAPAAAAVERVPRAAAPVTVPDDRATLAPGEPSLLIIEDDAVFAGAFGEIIRAQGGKCLIATDGRSGLELARTRRPSGIILDVNLPDTDGWTVMEALRADPRTAAIPVHFVTVVDEVRRGMALGAVGYLTKPTTHHDLLRVIQTLSPRGKGGPIHILVVEGDVAAADSLAKLLAGDHHEVRRAASAAHAMAALEQEHFDAMILDLSLPDMDGLGLLRAIESRFGGAMPSVVVCTARPLSKDEAKRLEDYAEAIVIKEGPFAERLLDEVRLFVGRLRDGVGPRRRSRAPLVPAEHRLDGRRILVADDDMRTVFALSAALRAKGAEVLVADTGKVALDVLAQHPEVDLVLMDIMMPEMDGYEAMRRIRQQERFRALPIIALTAKAMKGDQEKCLEAGATEYLAKPIDGDRLLSLVRSLLPRSTKHGA